MNLSQYFRDGAGLKANMLAFTFTIVGYALGVACLFSANVWLNAFGVLLNAQTLTINDQPGQNEIAVVVGQATGKTVIVTTSDAGYNTQQLNLIRALLDAQVPLIVVATRSPYDAMYLKDAPTVLVTYGLPPPSLRALAEVLTGRLPPSGKLPITLPP